MAFGPAEFVPIVTKQPRNLGLAKIGVRAPVSMRCRKQTATLHRPDPHELCYIQYSSGSTRFPTAVAETHENLLANARAMCRDGMSLSVGDQRDVVAAVLS